MLRPIHHERNIAFWQAEPRTPRDHVTYILLHGLGNSLDFWVAVAPELAAIDRTLAIDIPGFGRSQAPSDGFSLDHLAEDIARLVRSLDITAGIMVAHSLGAIVALRTLAIVPDRFSRLVLVDGTLGRAMSLLRDPGKVIRDPLLDIYLAAQFLGGILPIGRPLAQAIARTRIIREFALWPYVAHPGTLNPGVLAAALANNGGFAVAQSLVEAHRVDYPGLLAAVSQCVDLVWGAEDHLISPRDVAEATLLLRIKRTLEIPSCGHWPMIERPSVLADFIQSWPTSSVV